MSLAPSTILIKNSLRTKLLLRRACLMDVFSAASCPATCRCGCRSARTASRASRTRRRCPVASWTDACCSSGCTNCSSSWARSRCSRRRRRSSTSSDWPDGGRRTVPFCVVWLAERCSCVSFDWLGNVVLRHLIGRTVQLYVVWLAGQCSSTSFDWLDSVVLRRLIGWTM